jgi:mRNA interferase MazF
VTRGEIWTAAGGADYAGKPRPAVILQGDRFAGLRSATICSFTTDAGGEDVARLLIIPTPANGLREPSRLMVDKITTIPKSKLGYQIGKLDDTDLERLDEAIMIFLDLAS